MCGQEKTRWSLRLGSPTSAKGKAVPPRRSVITYRDNPLAKHAQQNGDHGSDSDNSEPAAVGTGIELRATRGHKPSRRSRAAIMEKAAAPKSSSRLQKTGFAAISVGGPTLAPHVEQQESGTAGAAQAAVHHRAPPQRINTTHHRRPRSKRRGPGKVLRELPRAATESEAADVSQASAAATDVADHNHHRPSKLAGAAEEWL